MSKHALKSAETVLTSRVDAANGRRLQVLIVDDEPALLDVTRIYLEKSGTIETTPALNATEARELLREEEFDAIVADYFLPGVDGIGLLKELRRAGDWTPFIIFTGRGREAVAMEALNSGADFYLQRGGDPKVQYAELQNFIEKAVRQREAEEHLIESERRYRNVVEDQTEFISRFLPDGTHVFVNDAYCRYFGKERDEIIGKVFRPNIPPEDQERVKGFFTTLTPDSPVGQIEHRIIMPDQQVRWQRWSDRAIFDEHGILVEYQSVGRDVTDRKDAEIALHRSERRLRAIVMGSPIATFVIDENHTVISWNHALEVHTRIRAQDIIGTNQHWRAFYDHERPCLADLLLDGAIDAIPQWYPGKWARSTLVKGAFEATDFFPHMGSEGTWLHFTAAPIHDEDGGTIGAIETLEDITTQKTAEIALKESEKKFRELADLLPQIVFETDTAGVLTYVNKEALRAFSYTEEEFKGGLSALQMIIPGERERAIEGIRRVMRGESSPGEEFTALRKDGSTFPMVVYATPIRQNGEVRGMRGLNIDITERKTMEEVERTAFGQIENNISQLCIINDQIRNPLAVIVALAAMEGGPTNEKILFQAKEINRIITDLDMGWLESEKIREFLKKHYHVIDR